MKPKLLKKMRFAVPAIALIAVGTIPLLGLGPGTSSYIVVAYNDLGMHCMNEDFSEIAILPPYNNLRAQVIRRGSGPNVISEDEITLDYSIANNTRSADKTNFWKYAPALFGIAIPPNIGLGGKGLSGSMDRQSRFYEAIGIPVTPIDDSGRLNPYPLGIITAKLNGTEVARTTTVIPVSQELSCNLCHNDPGVSMETDILRDHDRLHGTNLEASKPVLCAGCHADPALGTAGVPGVSMLSHAMHGAHASRVGVLSLANECYACHPGVRTQCHRDVHLANGVNCIDCHGDLAAVGSTARTPWVDEPRCSNCHTRAGFDFEEPGKLFKDSRGHGGVMCVTCHGSPHAIGPNVTAADNLQAERLQGHSGVLNTCTVCHTTMPDDPFPHRMDD
ncbi:MAG: hypothetical protein KDA32_05860 [Phycisphaerales bacterium]|nr:hypothetical protein [Phycisphaerales bacterium]